MGVNSTDNGSESYRRIKINNHSETEPHKSDDEKQPFYESAAVSSSLQSSTSRAVHLCVVCATSRRMLVLIPCGHFNACIPCGHGLKSCPTCGSSVQALLRIYE